MAQNSWARRARRLLLGLGTAGVVWFLLGYLNERMREAKARAAKERKERELIKSHFTTLLSTLHYTLYALLPTLQPQLQAAYPVESTSTAIQGLAYASSEQTPDSSLVLNPAGSPAAGVGAGAGAELPADAAPAQDGSSPRSVRSGQSDAREGQDTLGVPRTDRANSEVSVDGSWASEFRRQEADDDMLSASSMSVPISLPTNVSSSPTRSLSSDLSHMYPSPPQPRSKKELWRDLKVQSLTRALSTVYLLPLLYVLTTSQLSTLARTRYLSDVRASLPLLGPSCAGAYEEHGDDDEDDYDSETRIRRSASEATIRPDPPAARRGWLPRLSSFSVAAMGLSEYAAGASASVGASALNPFRYVPAALNPLAYVPESVKALVRPADEGAKTTVTVFEEEREREKEDAERVYLLYSWWILHVGWRAVAARVEDAVDHVFGTMPLKRELSVDEWDTLARQVRARVETTQTSSGVELYDLTQHLLPPTPVPAISGCPLPASPADGGAHLGLLLAQTRAHLASPDARLLLARGTDALASALADAVARDLAAVRPAGARAAARLADYLPAVSAWARGVWDGVPDNGVEALLAVPEYESFAALVFGDWADA
ncbi:peroxin [Cryptotrichosporon argae]